MKKVLSSLTVLFAAALLIYSCNPVDEDQLPPSNTSQLTSNQVTQQLQGVWYLDKTQSVNGPVCAGGPNETSLMSTMDLQYAGYKLEFTQNYVDTDEFNNASYEVYYNGGSGTTAYKVVENSIAQQYLGPYYTYNAGDFFIEWGGCIISENVGFCSHIKILQINANELVLYSWDPFPTIYYFKRSNQSGLPYNQLNLSGSFVIDNYKEVNSGVLDLNQTVANGSTYTFTDVVGSYNMKLLYTGASITPNVNGNPYLNLADFEAGSFYYEVSNTHIYSYGPSYTGGVVMNSYKIQQLNNAELILRQHSNCNTYTEYHLTKVN